MARTLADQPRRHGNKHKRKQGVVLLMVVSLLALFLLMGVTFAVLAMQYKGAATAQAEAERYGDPAMLELDLAFGQLLYDTANRSSLQAHSRLRDLYGTDYVQGQVSGAVSTDNNKTCSGNFTVFPITSSTALSDVPGYYNGRVLTFITGNCAGFSTRIAGYEPRDAGSGLREVFIEPVRSTTTSLLTPSANDTFVINGQPFNGMGFGYDPATFRLDAVVDKTNNRSAVLLPHFAGYPERGVYSTTGTTLFSPDAAGADEGWDAVDLQNLDLACVPPGLLSARIGTSNQFTVPLIPSFHRPDLLSYWLEASRWPGGSNIQMTDTAQQDLARQIIFRPMPWDHTNFTGSNPDLTPATNNDAGYLPIMQRMSQNNALQTLGSGGYYEAIWDVDNDGDGVRESVWVDVGLPVMTSPTGRRYKRLFAFLVKDLDGRVNINVHGNKAQTDTTNQASYNVSYPFPAFGPTAMPAAATFPNNNKVFPTPRAGAPLNLPRGLGFGPAEVDFQFVLSAAGFTSTDYTTLLNGRYGPGGTPGINGTDDSLSVLRMSGVPAYFVTNDSWYGSPPDVWGRSAVAVDPGGRPFLYRGAQATTNETLDDPYEMEWDPATAVNDTPYAATDMEQLLRTHDAGIQQFPGRLSSTLNSIFTGAGQPAANLSHQRVRESLTTMGANIPVVPGVFRYQDRQAHGSFTHTRVPSVINLYKRRLQEDGTIDVNDPTVLGPALTKLMPWEFWQGKPFNINRYLGNGLNDNSGTNSATDESQEQESGTEIAWGTNGMTGSTAPSGGLLPNVGGFSGQQGYPVNSVDVDNNGTPDQTIDRARARHLLARHLYCLMLAIKDSTYNPPNISGTQNNLTTRKMIAQWAVNVVDFRDPDGIITGFEYDTNPWNGWDVDGSLDTEETTGDRAVVWGCESPELILKETIAFHDRRVKDTDKDTTTKDRGAATMPDDDLDQFRVPQGSLFFELYCARTHGMYNQVSGQEAIYSPQMPFELYDKSTGKLDLARTSPNGNPVWQVAVSSVRANPASLPHSQTAQPRWEHSSYRDPTNDPTITTAPSYNLQYDNTAGIVEIDRYVWFTGEPGAMHPKRNTVFSNQRNWSAQLSPGQYMVVGPRETTYLGSNSSDQGMGATRGYWHGDSPQRITLNQTTGVEIVDAAGNVTSKLSTPAATAEIQPVAALVVDARPPEAWAQAALANRRVGLNVTEPLPQDATYYPEYNAMNDPWVPVDGYDDPQTPNNTLLDAPLDNTRLLGLANMLPSQVYANRAGIFLQRLADPTKDWNVRSNPYITVDFAPIDVTVFSGEEDTDRRVSSGTPAAMVDVDPSDPPGVRPTKFATGQRGVAKGNPWFPVFTETNLTMPVPGTSNQRYMELGLHHTFGYLNESLGTIRGSATNGAAYSGDPADADRPFPWITWNNRPFMNPAELLLVPTCAPNRLVLEASPQNPVVPNAAGNPYTATDVQNFKGPYGHLFNFFQSSTTDNAALNLARIFDYVETPSNFVGNERWYSPNQMTGAGSAPYPGYRPPHLYRPPFNSLSRFRDPGKINLNTIFDENIWKAVIGYDPSAGSATLASLRTPANEFFLSRQGYTGSIGQMNQAFPSIFSNPFRPADAADLMPNVPGMRKAPVEAGLLRQSTSRTSEPLLAYKSADTAIDTDRNPYFRYQGLQKMANLVGTQSNCYAAWVTVGYFEVEDTTPSNKFPDGFMLGQELGMDTGDIQRHRAFYLIDRSIPVGFIPGLKLNTDNCVLLRRQID